MRVSPRVAAIVLASGRGARLGDSDNKVYLAVGGRPMLEYSLTTFTSSGVVESLVVVARQEDHQSLRLLLNGLRLPLPVIVVEGGPTRHQSEMAGLQSLSNEIEAGTFDLVAIHDGARPFMTLELLEACIDAASRVGGAIPGLAPESPIHGIDHHRVSPIDSTTLIRVQTPQVFAARRLLDAYRDAAAAGFEGVDTAESVERFSDLRIEVVPGDERNLKITVPRDLATAAEYALDWEYGHWKTQPENH
jgi:2-C-methyl-D-erythritol 4-phosphate cytidylyltransferase